MLIASARRRKNRSRPNSAAMADPLQPDPARGVFATMLVVHGVPLELDAHLARLRTSVRDLYESELPADLAATAEACARGLSLGRLRLSLAPRAGGELALAPEAHAVDPAIVLPDWAHALDLRTAEATGWSGAHKWSDRRLLDRLATQASPAEALLVDPERGVLETTRANVFVVGPDRIVRTPPADGAILPGIARARVAALARAGGIELREQRLSVADLRAAREVFLTGSVRGVEPVRSLDGAPVGEVGAIDFPRSVAARLARELRMRWLGQAVAA
jgi:para-aminobenzoate synthetase / 4-amino-4-deoxychorismate lyase